MTGTFQHYNKNVYCSYAEIQFLFSGCAMSLGFPAGFSKNIGRLACSIAELNLDPSFWMLDAFTSCRSNGLLEDCRVSFEDTDAGLVFSVADGSSFASSLLYGVIVEDWLTGDHPLLFKDVIHPVLLCFSIRMRKLEHPVTCRFPNEVCASIDAEGISVYGSSLEDLLPVMGDIRLDFEPFKEEQSLCKRYSVTEEIPLAKMSPEGLREVRTYFMDSLVATKDSSGAGE